MAEHVTSHSGEYLARARAGPKGGHDRGAQGVAEVDDVDQVTRADLPLVELAREQLQRTCSSDGEVRMGGARVSAWGKSWLSSGRSGRILALQIRLVEEVPSRKDLRSGGMLKCELRWGVWNGVVSSPTRNGFHSPLALLPEPAQKQPTLHRRQMDNWSQTRG